MSELESDDSLLRALAQTPEIAPFVGTDRYRVCSRIGEGGFGVVYEVEDRETGRQLALKTLKTSFASSIQRLKREFRSVADLVHPNLVAVHELASDGKRWFFTMDLVRGVDFLSYARGHEARLRATLPALVAGLAALHDAGIIHRDLKPSNVLVDASGRVVILDFGLADGDVPAYSDASLERAGTPSYMAPEQAAGETATPALDWYAVGVMLYEALCGRLPFDEKSRDDVLRAKSTREPPTPSTHAAVAPDLERLCMALLHRDPAARPGATQILAMLGDAPEPATPRRAISTFVGRASELATLRAALVAVRAKQPTLVRIHGQPGVGKSTLLAQFLDEAREEATVLAGRCHERESVPFKAFDGIADALVRHLRELPRARTAALLPRDSYLVARLFPVLETIPALHDIVPPREPIADPVEARTSAFAAIKELAGRIASDRPLVIAVDDLQWGDVDSAKLLAQLVAPPDRPAVLLVLCHRSDESATLRETLRLLRTTGDAGIELAVQPLPPEDAEQLAVALLTSDSRAAARTIAERGEGHPLFMAELARAANQATELAAPTLMDILWQRVLRLPDTSRSLLETVAVAGHPLASDLCFHASGLAAVGIDALRVLRAEQLVVTGETGAINVFHDRIRDTILARVDDGIQRMRHLALATSLEHVPDADPEALARHFEAAQRYEKAVWYATRAGDIAMRTLAFARAATLYRMAIEHSATAPAALHEKLGDALLNAGANADAGHAYLEAAARTDGEHAIDLQRRAAVHLVTSGEFDPGYRALEEACAAVGEKVPSSQRTATLEGRWHLLRMRMAGFRRANKLDLARDQLRLDVLDSAATALGYLSPTRAFGVSMRCARIALEEGDARRLALGQIHAAYFMIFHQKSSRPAAVDRLLDAADATATRLTEPNLLAHARRRRADTRFMFGDLRGARELATSTAALISDRCVGMGYDYRWMVLVSAIIDLRLGDIEPARARAAALLRDALERNDPVTERGVCVAVLSPLSLVDDDPDRAQHYVERVGLEDRCGILVYRAESAAATAMYRGRPHDAVDAWRSRWSRIDDEGMLAPPGFQIGYVRSLGTALLASPASVRDVREAARLARSIRRIQVPYAAAVYATLEAYLALHDRRRDTALAALERAAARYDDAAMPLEAAACRLRLGELRGDSACIAAAVAALRARGIVAPERWAAMIAPAARA